MLAVAGHPFQTASNADASFQFVMDRGIMGLLRRWKMECYVTGEMVECIESMLKYEIDRIDLKKLQQSAWIRGSE